MPKRRAANYNVDLMQPDEINQLKALAKEFIGRMQNVDNEIELLAEDRKALIDEYSTKLDMKTLTAALRVLKIKSKVEHKDTFDLFVETLTEVE